MTENHPITPPPELVREWNKAAIGTHFPPYGYSEYIATQAARWGADQELEACISWMQAMGYWGDDGKAIPALRAARRPTPPSLKEQAQAELNRLIALIPTNGALAMAEPIRRALETLPE